VSERCSGSGSGCYFIEVILLPEVHLNKCSAIQINRPTERSNNVFVMTTLHYEVV
jgi:hypothetical protein